MVWVWLHLLGIVGVAMVSRIAKNFQDYYKYLINNKVWLDVYQSNLRHIFSLPFAVFEDQHSGQLLQKLNDVRLSFESFINEFINTFFIPLVALTFVIVYAFWVHWLIGLLYMSLIPIMGITMFLLSRKLQVLQKNIGQQVSVLSGSMVETIRNVAMVKSLGLENQELQRLENTNIQILGLQIDKIKFIRFFEFTQGTFVNAMRVGIMWTMFWLVYTNAISLWEFMTLFFYSFYVFNPVGQFGVLVQKYQELQASTLLLQEITSLEPEYIPADARVLDTIHTIAFDNVSFAYTYDKNVLHTISFRVSKWETIAFVGPSGSGKSTILKLLVGLYKATDGSVCVNDFWLSTLDPVSYKLRLGLVSQDAQMFGWTIRENLLFVKPDATDDDMMLVLQQAKIADLVTGYDTWLDTKIGEGGIKISWWQRQRLAIARALLRNPDVIIFDEATSSLDSLVEQEITDTIRELRRHRPDVITILVAHRLSTVMHADRIYVLEKWSVQELGDHNTLLATQGLYAAMRRQQTGELPE